MVRSDLADRLVVLAIGLLIVLGPVVLLVLTLGFLMVTGDLLVNQVTPVEFLELYVIDLLLFSAFGYGVYRLTLTLVESHLPASLDALEGEDAEREATDTSDDAE
ncbi:hypothetical protein [Halorarum salinum]|uniref:Uncharacterized protein n=1 Tax=Halorarum salinum TaxID=2743089 RepID=A0A7D5LBR4_9EURY|nr:hypothetical protein [Halobaculum salinum]QLG62754.1 hypothetical protein HUG12_13865 [Halobaculum salinum]